MIPGFVFRVSWLGLRFEIVLGVDDDMASLVELLGSVTEVDEEDTGEVPFGFRP